MSAQSWASSACTCRRIFQSRETLGYESRYTTSALAPARSASSMRFRNSPRSRSVKLDVFVFDREVVDAALGRRDPAGHPARLDHALHEGMDEGAVRLRRDSLLEAPVVVFF